MDRPTIPDVLDRFRSYHAREPSWGALHVVLDDINLTDAHVRQGQDFARERGDEEGYALGEILLKMTITQRLWLALNA
ncbi:hypothetical protein Mnod_3948 [Methylobacterium nodulans ORS 2060]|uniref:Uncharacterized protein n=1 Tax=Methylobacterium nodulans (strain LMG 21967 / CNCM I-2342 / ORS 2060) TaxID=460265 RepID=B8ISK0_METNO|nr:hypothetical protein Mnod_3948 [Methylobacterium nodulans ORS 2060]